MTVRLNLNTYTLAWQLVNLVKYVPLKISVPLKFPCRLMDDPNINHSAIESPFPFLLRSVSLCLQLRDWNGLF